MFEYRVLRRIFGAKGDEVKSEWKKLHTQYYSSNQIEKNENGQGM